MYLLIHISLTARLKLLKMAEIQGFYWVIMNHLFQVARVLDSCLTTETLKKLAPMGSKGNGDIGRNGKLFADLLEYAGQKVMEELKRDLASDEVILIFNRIQQFLIARGLD
jgi:hypothetical protein